MIHEKVFRSIHPLFMLLTGPYSMFFITANLIYRISSGIRRSFFFFQNNPKDLDPSCKTDLDLWDCLGRVNLVL